MASLLIENASQILTMAGAGWEPLTGNRMRKIRTRKDAVILVSDGKILEIADDGKAESLKKKYDAIAIDARGNTVMPGLVDSHTHIVYGGTREEEFYMKVKGKSYLEILSSGNGIYRTVEQTRASSEEQVFRESLSRLYDAVSTGTTTMEIKTGYGLDIDTEVKMMKAIERLSSLGLMNVIRTFLPLHAIPKGTTEMAYVHDVVERFLPRIAGKAEFVDSFCDKGAFSPESTDEFFSAAESMGFKLRMHSDELGDIGCLSLCEKHSITSADHLLFTEESGIKRIKCGGAVATFLPITAFNIADGKYPDISRFISSGIPVALATDSSPVSYNSSLMFAIYLAVRFCKMTIEEALNAVTVNAAYSLGILGETGSIEPSKRADIIILSVDDYTKIPYQYGSRLVDTVINNGEIVMRNGVMAL